MTGRNRAAQLAIVKQMSRHNSRSSAGPDHVTEHALFTWRGSDKTERLHFRFSLSCIGEGNGKPLQCSCLENPRDRWAWWVAVYGVAQSRTRLKWLSGNLSMIKFSKQKSLSGWINFKKQHLTSCCLKETHFSFRDTHSLKEKGWEKIIHADRNQNRAKYE